MKTDIAGGNHNIVINDPETKNIFYEREISYLKREIKLKDKEIEARDRDILMLKELFEELRKSRDLNTELYERKISDLKNTIDILKNKLIK